MTRAQLTEKLKRPVVPPEPEPNLLQQSINAEIEAMRVRLATSTTILDWERILLATCVEYHITWSALIGDRKAPAVLVAARRHCAARLKDELGLSSTAIGRLMGNRDHATVLNYLRPKRRLNPRAD